VVVNAISLETVAQITELAAGKMQTEIIQVQVSRAKTVGTYHLMQAENPVYICVLTMA
jgi:precorrin-6Y C5,15-methyltransferase (decarboxylating)